MEEGEINHSASSNKVSGQNHEIAPVQDDSCVNLLEKLSNSKIVQIGDGSSSKKSMGKEVNEEIRVTQDTGVWGKPNPSLTQGIDRKLEFIEPTKKHDRVIARIQKDEIQVALEYWKTSIICYMLGANPPFFVVSGYLCRIWGKLGIDKILLMDNGVYIARFKSMAAKEEVLRSNIYHFDHHPLIVKDWSVEEGFKLEDVKMVPVWVQFSKLQLRYWTAKTLSRIPSVLGKPLELDELTATRNRAAFARILVEMPIRDHMPDAVWFEDENGILQEQKIKYEWLPVKCGNCAGYGHEIAACRKPVQKTWKERNSPSPKQLEEHDGTKTAKTKTVAQEAKEEEHKETTTATKQITRTLNSGIKNSGKLQVTNSSTQVDGKQSLSRKE
ncbi:OLC1v1024631C1 [Oldenlandia corymbosa var. corymbosa]|uniref:OLC1v1024631C1 n=1 Tax=Oldenlandia corymbosa var. corymbosa TaxID=529605 RepID=A0AAV1C479_OLDCO|nr:OLC1v1024631C1 [Oldenlandia corymbosa var. corymbosa]